METTELTAIMQLLERVDAALAHAASEHQVFVLTLLQSKAITRQGTSLATELQLLRESLVVPTRDRPTAVVRPQVTPHHAAYCTEREVAQILQVSLGLLRKWRVKGKGPPFVKLGRLVRYPRRDLDAFPH